MSKFPKIFKRGARGANFGGCAAQPRPRPRPQPRRQKISIVYAVEVAEIFADVVAEILRRRVVVEILAEKGQIP